MTSDVSTDLRHVIETSLNRVSTVDFQPMLKITGAFFTTDQTPVHVIDLLTYLACLDDSYSTGPITTVIC